MSAIWGIIDFNKKEISEQDQIFIRVPYESYRIDSINQKSQQHVLFGCGLQYFRPNSSNEELPYYDKTRQIYYTADVFLDNREELIRDLQIEDNQIPDGKLLYEAYLSWGPSFTDHCLGCYSAAFYHEKEQTAYLYTDPLGNRCLNYSYENNRLIFSTLSTPITNVTYSKPSKKWMAACLSTYSPDMFLFPELTPFEEIKLMLPARELTINMTSCKQRQYWNPVKIKEKIRFEDKSKYEALLIDTLQTCIHSFLDTPYPLACTLSSGLDSSTVACMAASALAKEGRQLHSYTSIPLKDYQSDHKDYYITDESEGVNVICKQYPNIVPTFLECEDSNDLRTIQTVVPLLEYPSKSGHNLTWINDIYHKAYEDGCRILLKGQYGNCTISYGNFFSVFQHELKHLHFKKAFQLLDGFCNYHHASRKRALKIFFKNHLEKLKPPSTVMQNELLNPNIDKTYSISKQIKKLIMHSAGGEIDSFKQRKQFMFEENGLTQLSVYDTKFSLIHGLLIRDPLKDKRLIELCCKLPYECVIAGNVERAMVRTYLHDIVPKEIRMNLYHRGLQSADSVYRMQLEWEKNMDLVVKELSQSSIREFLKEKELDDFLKQLPKSKETADYTLLLRVEALYPSSYFYQHFFQPSKQQ